MQKPREKTPMTASWSNAMAPLLMLSTALLVACAAKQYSDAHPSAATRMANGSAPGTLDLNSHAPDFTLENAHGGTVTLSAVTAKKPALLVFYLGYNCPRCVHHLNDLSKRQAEFEKIGAQVIAISPDTVAEERDSIATYGDFKFPLLSDPQMKVARQYGLVHGDDMLFHGIYIVDTQGNVRFAMKSAHPYDNVDALLACMKDVTGEK